MAATRKMADAWESSFRHLKKLGKTQLKSNRPISSTNPAVADGLLGGITGTFKNMDQAQMGFLDSVNAAHRKVDGGLNYGAIAGSYVGVSAGLRVASGGGLHRDRHGNPNIIGIPFF